MFAWDLIFCLFKRNERRRDFCIKQVYDFFVLFLKKNKISFGWDLTSTKKRFNY